MNIDLEVKVLWRVGRNNPSKPQGDNRESVAESSGERATCGATNRNRIEGGVDQGERTENREALCDQRATS
jgi:hypothetical protein